MSDAELDLRKAMVESTKQTEGTRAQPGALACVRMIFVGGTLAMAGTSSAEPGQVWEVDDSPELWATTSAYGSDKSDALLGAEAAELDTTQRAISELRRLSGLTWEQLADLFGVSRRSLHFWASGQPLAARNEELLRQVLAIIRAMDRGDAASNRAALLDGASGSRALDLLREERFEEAHRLLGTGVGRVARTLPKPSKRSIAEREPLPPDVLVDAHEEPVHRDAGRRRPARTTRGKRRGSP